jgi:hypothetical protein
MSTSDREKADFMREVGASHATWGVHEVYGETLTSLTLGADPTKPGPAAQMAKFHQQTAAQRLQNRHDVLFAASTTKPVYEPPPAPPSAVPRAVRAKEAAAKRGQAR